MAKRRERGVGGVFAEPASSGESLTMEVEVSALRAHRSCHIVPICGVIDNLRVSKASGRIMVCI